MITGTRPEIIKMAPIIIRAQKDSEINLVHADSTQHFDDNMNRNFFIDLNLPYPDYILSLDRTSEITQLSSMLVEIAKTIEIINPDFILGQGDTNTVMASALTANRLGYKFGHVEAGLRSFDLNMPEEINRRIADICASIHFCPTNISGLNLIFEGIEPHRIYITGNTIVDVVKNIKSQIKERSKKHNFDSDPSFSKTILVTLHRPSNVDDESCLKNIFSRLEEMKEYQFIIPFHPRTLNNIKKFGLFNRMTKTPNFKILDPLGYFDFLSLLLSVDVVLTDSGGVQEECHCLSKRCLTLRNNTERPETISTGMNKLIDITSQNIRESIDEIINLKIQTPIPQLLGDGDSAVVILNLIKALSISDLDFRSPKMHKWSDYQYQQKTIEKEILLTKYEKEKNRRILMIFDHNGTSHIPESESILRKNYKVVLFGNLD